MKYRDPLAPHPSASWQWIDKWYLRRRNRICRREFIDTLLSFERVECLCLSVAKFLSKFYPGLPINIDDIVVEISSRAGLKLLQSDFADRYQGGSLKAWLRPIFVNYGRSSLKPLLRERQSRSPVDDLDSIPWRPEEGHLSPDHIIGYPLWQEVQHSLALLPEAQRFVIHHIYLCQMTHEQVAQLRGVQKNTVRRCELRALEQLRKLCSGEI